MEPKFYNLKIAIFLDAFSKRFRKNSCKLLSKGTLTLKTDKFRIWLHDLVDVVAHITFAKFQPNRTKNGPLGALLRSQRPVPRLARGSKNGFLAFADEQLDLQQSHANLYCRTTKNTP